MSAFLVFDRELIEDINPPQSGRDVISGRYGERRFESPVADPHPEIVQIDILGRPRNQPGDPESLTPPDVADQENSQAFGDDRYIGTRIG